MALPMINLLNPDGTYNENAGKYAGLDRIIVRKRIVEDLKAAGFLERVESYIVRLNHSDRSKTPIEPYLSDQWFVRMGDEPDGTAGFAQQAMDAVTSGRINIHPARYAKSYLDWLGEKRDWCISRQLWWGHRIPIWHCGTCTERDLEKAFAGRGDVVWRTGESGGWLLCGETDLRGDELGSEHTLTQDPDVLDTWFSSALWPHSTLGWPEETAELREVLSDQRSLDGPRHHHAVGRPNGDLRPVQPRRSAFPRRLYPPHHPGWKGPADVEDRPATDVDPVDIIEIHGADALRYTLASGATETQDLRIPVEPLKLPDGRVINTSERFEQGRNFANKFWNAARLTLMNLRGYEPAAIDPQSLAIEDRWILDRLDCTIEEVTSDFEQFQFAEAVRRLRDFTWGDFCDWYLEFVKGRLRDEQVETRSPARASRCARLAVPACFIPIVPFVTEQAWQGLNALAPERGLPQPAQAAESVCIAAWPRPIGFRDETARRTVGLWCEVIKALRNLKAERNVPEGSSDRADPGGAWGCRRVAGSGRGVPEEPLAGEFGDDRFGGRAAG